MKSDIEKKILHLIREKRRVSYKELAQHLNLSVPTVRKKIEKLLDKNPLSLIYGGVEYGSRKEEGDGEILCIAKEAALLVSEGDVIYMGPGRTVAAMCPYLKDYSDLTVFTNSLHVIQAFVDTKNISLFAIGGMFQRSNMAFTLYGNHFGNINISKAFISATAVDPDIGISHRILANKETAELISSNAKKIVFLASTDKFKVQGTFIMMPVEAVHTLVSSEALSPDIVKKFKDKSIEVRLAPLK